MNIIFLAIGACVFIFVLVAVMKSSPQDADEEAAQEAKHASPEELDHALHPSPKTPEGVADENEMYEDK